MGGWLGVENENNANSAFNQVGVEVEAEQLEEKPVKNKKFLFPISFIRNNIHINSWNTDLDIYWYLQSQSSSNNP